MNCMFCMCFLMLVFFFFLPYNNLLLLSIGAVHVTVSSGDTAFLPCPLLFKYNYTMRIDVKWEKDGGSGLCTYSIQNNRTNDHNCSPQYKVNTDPLGLNITGVESSDAGLYTCLMNKVIPPPVLSKNSTVRLSGDYNFLLLFIFLSNDFCHSLC